jgi:peptidoglycan hydrolase-like protein with peptidoglycan-binding domain
MKITELFEQTNPTLRMGSRGPAVGRIQQILGGDLKIDNVFGSETRKAVIDFQRKNKLNPDGVVGPQTWTLLLKTSEPSVSLDQKPNIDDKTGTKEKDDVSKSTTTTSDTDVKNVLKFGSRTGSEANFEKLQDAFQEKIEQAAIDYNKRTGKQLKITSAFRNPADQQRLWDQSVKAGTPGIQPNGIPVGRPGSSKHEKGLAVDIDNYDDPQAVAAMNRQGLYQTVKNDPPHFTTLGEEYNSSNEMRKIINSIEIYEQQQINPTLRMGNRGASVTQVQQILGITQTGVYDNATQQAIIKFQTDNKLNPDGVVGPQTWRELAKVSTTASPTTSPTTPPTKPTTEPSVPVQKVDARKEPGFMPALSNAVKSLGVNIQDILAVIQKESGFNPAARNSKSGASGLIQFMPRTAKSLGTSVEEIRAMSGTEQIPLIQKYFWPYRGKLNSVEDLYMVTFLPAALNLNDNFVVGVQGSKDKIWGIEQGALYSQNKGFDANKKGYYTVGDIRNSIKQTKMGMA